ncbi:MAG: DUF2470 domain-containing protein [Pseudomonadota bacterium]
MAQDHAVQPDADTPVQVAKRLLREERRALVAGVDVPLASMVTGAPLVHLAEVPGGEVTVEIGALSLTCTARALSEEEVTNTAARYIMRNGGPKEDGQFVALEPVAAQLDGAELDPAALLTAGSGELMTYERRAVDHMNDDHLDAVKNYAQVLLGAETGEWRLASLDMEGLDLVRCDADGLGFRRLWFHPPLTEPGDIKSKLVELAMAGRG